MSDFMTEDFGSLFGEEDEVVKVSAKVQETPEQKQVVQESVVKATTQVVPVQATQEVSTFSGDDFEIDIPEELQHSLEEMGVIVGDLGTKVSKIPIEKYKASTTKVDRVGFLTKKVMAVKFHYIQGVGSIVCFNGKCCEVGGTPQVRYLFPIAVYSTDGEGNISGKKVELKVLAAGEDLYKSIMTINKGAVQQGGIDHVDLLVTCMDDKYQKLSLTFAGPAVWRKYKPIAEFLSDRWKKDGANAYMAVARKCDEPAFLKLMGLDADTDSSANDTFDASKSADLSKFFDE